MKLKSLKKSRTSLLMTGVLAAMLSMSACQQDPEPSVEDNISEEQAAPMSAEPAEPSSAVVADATINEVESDTVATINDDVMQRIYLCSPTLKVEATYLEDDNQVVLGTDKGTVTLTQTNEGTNPEAYEVSTNLSGGEGYTQWRTAHQERETGVLRTANADESNINTYECNDSQ
ncbi:hypothetical protein [Psychrobacter sp. DM4]|uniref:hypothetical protein n=1 Tax=Psychrobacter sp. DM4 TaxID=3440637 RepID=UPI003F4F895D